MMDDYGNQFLIEDFWTALIEDCCGMDDYGNEVWIPSLTRI